MFFQSWALWEKMTFVLAVAILLVFCVGWGKLIWTNRLVKKQELVDEEKRTRIQELRKSGQIIESSKNHDVPFGVRAIQSGIQVDGIWQSHPATPVPKEVKDLEAGSIDSEATRDLRKSGQISWDSLPLTSRPTSKQDKSLKNYEHSNVLFSHLSGSQEPPYMDRPASSATRMSYKPQRSSHLRYGSHGEYDEETLEHLEGKPLPKKKPHAQRPRGPRFDKEADSSSAADNERSSGTSSDSDATLSQAKDEVERSREVMASEPLIRHTASPSPTKPVSKKAGRGSLLDQGFRSEYFSVPTESSRYEPSDPFATPMPSSFEASRGSGSITIADIREANQLVDEPVKENQSSSPFIPGELHMNKYVRKVNSGFEVLPAGTFGPPGALEGKGINHNHEDAREKRQSTKLQKRPRNSTSSRP